MDYEFTPSKKLLPRDFVESKFRKNNYNLRFGNENQVPSISKNFPIFDFFARFIYKSQSLSKFTKAILPKLPIWFQSAIYQRITNSSGAFQQPFSFQDFYSVDLGIGLKTSEFPLVSVLIPVHNKWWITLKCLLAIQALDEKTRFEIILIDDASSDITVEATKALRGVHLLTIKNNVGYLRANNLGAKFAKGKYLLLLNNDTEPQHGWLDSLVSTIEENENVAIVGSKLIYANGKLQESGCIIFANGNAWNIGRNKNPFQGEYDFVKESDYCSAASILVKRDFWESVGGFDERYAPAYSEDADLCMAAWSAGFRVLYDPGSLVIHHEGQSHGTNIATGIKRYQNLNKVKFYEKWSFQLSNHWNLELERNEFRRESRGIVVLIDRQLPARYRDAGSIRTIQIAQSISRSGYHVVLAALDKSTSLEQIVNLKRQGIEVHQTLNGLWASLETRKERLHAVWYIRNEVYEYCNANFLEITNKFKSILDLGDLDYYKDANGKIMISRNQINSSKKTELIVLINSIEASYLLQESPELNIKLLWAIYEPNKISYQENLSQRKGLLFIGGFRHKPNLEALKWFATEVLPGLKSIHPSYEVKVVGTGLGPDEVRYYEQLGIQMIGSVDNLEEVYESSEIAIIPLRSGRGKKGKLGEALAFGMPIVATTVAAEDFNLRNGTEALITDSPEGWIDAITKLHSDLELRKELSQNALEYARVNLGKGNFDRIVLEILDA